MITVLTLQRHTMMNPALANSCHGNSPYFFSMEHNVYVLAGASFLSKILQKLCCGFYSSRLINIVIRTLWGTSVVIRAANQIKAKS